ncbi:hypothetical protein PV394_31495 [Streptomyces sp. NE06-03E]|uniref:hypothetical protein n=1 Tax=Streptomyces sp. NE06-03E TaxID=3028695 RepID=UPI0029B41401|nr:hypothetical protein [Streptomyces sp. NE06-03E]MDX3059607.1 hypothetical protein [Streptomyces sp. NE06-03E]MDX3059608.1 hypothetical protein [Streptomyces sp. NE06-03E]
MSDETTKPSGQPCAWCGEPVRQSGIGRTRKFCGRTCRELSYRDRKQDRAVKAAVAQALAAARVQPSSDSSVVETTKPDSSVVERRRPVGDTAAVERRRLSRNRSHMTADPFPRLPPEQLSLDE